MKKFLMLAAAVFFMAAPAMAMDDHAHAEEGHAMEAAAEVTAEAPAVEAGVDAAAAAKEECTAETNEKVKLPENAGDAEKAQWDAAFAECVKGKGVEADADVVVEEAPADVNVEVETTTEEAPAAE